MDNAPFLPHPATIHRAGVVLTFTLNRGAGNAVIGSRPARWRTEETMPAAARVLRIPYSATSPAFMANAPPTTQNPSTAKFRA